MLLVNPKYDVDPARHGYYPPTGLIVRAYDPSSGPGQFDAAELTADSLLRWLRRAGGVNPVAENLVGILLGYGLLTAADDDRPTVAEAIGAYV